MNGIIESLQTLKVLFMYLGITVLVGVLSVLGIVIFG